MRNPSTVSPIWAAFMMTSLEATYEESKHPRENGIYVYNGPVWKLPMRNPSGTMMM